MSWTRRQFLEMVGMLGGSVAVHEVMTAMGWMKMQAWDGPVKLESGSGRGKKVLVLGAGIGGLTAAFELRNAGYEVLILEPQQRAGGRSLTARRGTVVTEESEKNGVTTQTCQFDESLYLNMGPGRLPFHHRRVLHYCHILGVPLEVYNMTTTANLWERKDAFAGNAMVRRQLQTDAQGYIAEMMAKEVCKGSLNKELSTQEREWLLDLLVTFGDLNATGSTCVLHDGTKEKCGDPASYKYCGSTRSGCAQLDIFDTCTAPQPVPLRTLLRSQFWAGSQGSFYQPLEFEWQPTLFQPVGGMDMIWKGFLREIGTLAYRSEVTRLTLSDDSVEVEYLNQYSGQKSVLKADYCISNIPLPILQKIPANFTDDFAAAVNVAKFSAACKVGWQANNRFWENDANQIYGGISYIEAPITQIWYPSYQYFEPKGTLTGAYNYPPQSDIFGELSLRERLRDAREQAARLHPEFNDRAIIPEEKGMSIAWQNIPHQRGGWANWKAEDKDHADAYERLLAPDRRFHIVGDQVSTLPGWQEGAMMSAEHVVEQIGKIRPMTVPDIKRAPSTRKMILGVT